MGRNVSRIITVSACFGQRVNALGEFEDFSEVLNRAITAEKATSYFRRKYDDETITINKVETSTDEYFLTVEEFLAVAHIKED